MYCTKYVAFLIIYKADLYIFLNIVNVRQYTKVLLYSTVIKTCKHLSYTNIPLLQRFIWLSLYSLKTIYNITSNLYDNIWYKLIFTRVFIGWAQT